MRTVLVEVFQATRRGYFVEVPYGCTSVDRLTELVNESCVLSTCDAHTDERVLEERLAFNMQPRVPHGVQPYELG